jgi:CRISPR-associated endonuclease/helicase Cas3
MDKIYAHSLPGKALIEWQPLCTHLKNVANIASNCAKHFNSADWAWDAAWLHDLGKAANEFQAYLRRQNSVDDDTYDDVGPGRVNHSSAGAAYALDILGPKAGLAIAYLVAGHHAGLPDYFSSDTGRAALQIRLEEGRTNLGRIKSDAETIDQHLRHPIKPPAFVNPANCHLWLRMLFSCLVDADFLETECFMNPLQKEFRCGYPAFSVLKKFFDAHMRKIVSRAGPTTVNIARKEILSACRGAATQAPGLFTLTVPTGGGKTLSAMAFALDHGAKHGKRRIIYVIPYTSIIEQTAAILSDIFGAENVVEHHSNLDPDKETQRTRLASENWDAPIIVTTNVQFFESLYAAKPSRCRKLHNIVNSVIILDEAQLLPPELLEPCVEVIKDLVNNYGVTVVLSTATQPALPNLDNFREIVADPDTLYERLKRTAIIMPPDLSLCTDWPDIAGRVRQHDQALCVVNTRRDCYELHKGMPHGTVHLSALMCGEHRSEVIGQIKQRLKQGAPVRVISTQLVEAGVDMDFPVVYRALAGLDAIAQAAGRCNREGKLNAQGRLGEVHVFVPPKPAPRGLLLKGENTTRELFALADFDPVRPEAFTRYFELFYSRVNDTGGIFKEMLQRDAPNLEFHFRTAANQFRLIDETQRPLFVQFGKSGQWLDDLRRCGPKRQVMRKLQRYVVNISKGNFEKAKLDGLVEQVWSGFWCWIGKYDPCYGLDLFGAGWAPEDLMV